MKKFLKYIIGFSLIYLVLHVMVVISVGPLVTYYRIGSAGQMFNRVNDIPNHHGSDVLFIGSSHTYRGFDTRLFEKAGYKSFNLGSSAQTPMQTELLLHRYLDEINPKSIVFEVYHVLFQNDGIESMADLISNDHIDMEICNRCMLKCVHIGAKGVKKRQGTGVCLVLRAKQDTPPSPVFFSGKRPGLFSQPHYAALSN